MLLLDHLPLVEAARLHYRQPHRGYHNQEHLDELIALARRYTPDLDTAEQLALLFHDAVYVPGAGHGLNEVLSARLMRATIAALGRTDRLVAGLAEADLQKAATIIEATTHDREPPAEAARLCDLDLWRLAAPWPDFERHADGVRHEYLHLVGSDEAFWTARRAFYRDMLKKPHLFATADFRDRFEAAARANLERAST
jgi:predicted metal-dependent HD superfamily phosphohydrolase